MVPDNVENNAPVFIGISFGTLYSFITLISKDGKIITIANEDGERSIPSCVAFTPHDELIGSQAQLQAVRNPTNTIVHFRSLLAKSIDSDEVKKHAKQFRFNIVANPENADMPVYAVESWADPEADSETAHVSPKEITQKYLEKMKQTAEAYLGLKVDGCVISEPVSFTDKESEALIDATKLAGFDHVYTIKEPVAAALVHEMAPKSDRNILVVDFGGHAFNVSILAEHEGLYNIISSKDDLKLGGAELDEVLVKLVADEFYRKTKLNVNENRRAMMKLRYACEKAKRVLSQLDVAPCTIESLHEGVDYTGSLNKHRFELAAEPIFQRCASLIKEVLASAKISPSQIDDVLLIGGSSKTPRFQSIVKSIFAACPEVNIQVDLDPDEVVARGCIAQSQHIASVGIDHYNTSIKESSITEKTPHTTHSLGIENAQGKMCVLIPAGVPVPVSRTVRFSNSTEGQANLFMSVYEGENAIASKNKLLSKILISELPSGLAVGAAKLDVTFTIENDLVLHVDAEEKSSGQTLKVVVEKK